MNPLFPKYRLLLCVAVGIAFFALPVYSQTVMGGDTMDASAMLDVQRAALPEEMNIKCNKLINRL
jgi:hypothetical protein